MRVRVAAVVSIVAVMIVAAIIASYFLERVEVPHTVVEPAAPVVVERPVVKPAVVFHVVDSGVVAPPPTAPRVEEVETPGVTALVAPGSAALRKLCQDAVDTCARQHRSWYPSPVVTELELVRKGAGSRVVAAHASVSKKQGPPAFINCISDALMGGEIADLALEAEAQMARCLPRSPKSGTVFPDGAKFRDVLKGCLPRLPESELTVEFMVLNDNGTLRNSDLQFIGFEPDAYARRCIEVGLEAKVSVLGGDAPVMTPRVSLSVSESGGKVSNSYSFSGPR